MPWFVSERCRFELEKLRPVERNFDSFSTDGEAHCRQQRWPKLITDRNIFPECESVRLLVSKPGRGKSAIIFEDQVTASGTRHVRVLTSPAISGKLKAS